MGSEAGQDSGTGGTSVIDAAQPDTGGENLCKATTNPFDPICDQPDACMVSCETTKSSTTYTNALYGCASTEDTCAAATSCLDGFCK